MKTVPIQLAPLTPYSYDVLIGPGLLGEIGPRVAKAMGSVGQARAFVIHDIGLPPGLLAAASASLRAAGFTVTAAPVRAAETAKTLDTFAALLVQLAGTRHERRDPIIALGGGIIGDLAGFVAATYRRGVPVIQCPTTLLSMVDASVGGKTGVNLDVGGDLRKNLVGAFHQPALVLADVSSLGSLPIRHLRAGLAECIKHGLISGATDPSLLDWTLDHLDSILACDAAALTELVERNLRVKASFVADDEREEKPAAEGGRALLNLGHTFAHAIETIPHLSPTGDPADAPLHHGEAVALGLVAAAHTSSAMDLLPWADAERIKRTVEAAGLPSRIEGLPSDEAVIDAMSHDKKVASGRLRLVLPVSIGQGRVIENPPSAAISTGLASIRG